MVEFNLYKGKTMFDVFGLKKIWDTFSPWASQENPLHAEFQAGIEREMQRKWH